MIDLDLVISGNPDLDRIYSRKWENHACMATAFSSSFCCGWHPELAWGPGVGFGSLGCNCTRLGYAITGPLVPYLISLAKSKQFP